MTKKQTKTAKKAAKPVKKARTPAKKTTANTKNTRAPDKKTRTPSGSTARNAISARERYPSIPDNAVTHTESAIEEQRVELLPSQLIEDTLESLQNLMADFEDVSRNNLNLIQRRRKIGAGIKNYGYIEKVSDLAEANPQFAQFFRPLDLRNCIRNFDMCREVALLLQGFLRMVTNTMLVYSNEAYGLSGIFYSNVKELSRRGDPKALELFRALSPFFKKSKPAAAQPTGKKTERDMHALLHGKKDGKIIIENISPKLSGGVHKVVDETFKDSAVVKESGEGEVRE